jgi:hypothetical protein
VLESIKAALPEATAGHGTCEISRDPVAVAESLVKLKQLLESDDGEAADLMVDAKFRLSGVLTPAELKTLTDRVDNYDFESALKCLSGIASRLSLDLEGE